MLGYLFATRLVFPDVVILSEVPRFFFSRGVCAARDGVEGPLFDLRIAEWYIQERFLDCVSRRFAQNQKHGTLRSE